MLPGCLASEAQPTLQGENGLILRPWLQSDAPGLVGAYQDPDIYRWHCRCLTLADAESWVSHELDRWQQDLGSSWAGPCPLIVDTRFVVTRQSAE